MSLEHRIIIGADKLDMSYSRDTRFLRFACRFVTIGESGEIRNPSSSSYDYSPFADLVITAQADSSNPFKPYGFEVEYRNVYSLQLRQAEGAVKLLRKLDKGLDKLQTEFGYADTYAAYVARVGKVLGISQYGWTNDDSSTYDDNYYQWHDATWIASRVDKLTRDWCKSAGIEVS